MLDITGHKEDKDALKVARTAGIHQQVCIHIHVHMSMVFNNASALHSWHGESHVR